MKILTKFIIFFYINLNKYEKIERTRKKKNI